MSDPTTTIGIVTCNRAALLPKAIKSCLDQAGIDQAQISILDDGSTDETPAIAQRFPRVRWIHWPENKGYIIGRNFLMESSKHEFFVGLDDDAWFTAGDEIEIACRHLRENAEVAAVAFDILSPDRPTPLSRRPPEPAAMFIGCGHVLRVDAIRRAGFYENSPGSYGGEEKDLCLRLMDLGYRIVRLPGVHVWHDKSPLARESSAQLRSGVCNDLVMAMRRTPAFLLPGALLMKVYRHLVFGMRNHAVAPVLGGLRMFFKEIPEIWKSRKAVRASTLRRFMRLRT